MEFCHWMHPLMYLATLCWDILLEKHPEPVVIDESAFCLAMTFLICLTWILLLTMWNVWLTKFRDLWGLVDPLHWQGYLFRYGVPSARVCNGVPSAHLCSGVAMLAHHPASGILD